MSVAVQDTGRELRRLVRIIGEVHNSSGADTLWRLTRVKAEPPTTGDNVRLLNNLHSP
jgi:hypothetical protein